MEGLSSTELYFYKINIFLKLCEFNSFLTVLHWKSVVYDIISVCMTSTICYSKESEVGFRESECLIRAQLFTHYPSTPINHQTNTKNRIQLWYEIPFEFVEYVFTYGETKLCLSVWLCECYHERGNRSLIKSTYNRFTFTITSLFAISKYNQLCITEMFHQCL